MCRSGAVESWVCVLCSMDARMGKRASGDVACGLVVGGVMSVRRHMRKYTVASFELHGPRKGVHEAKLGLSLREVWIM